MYRMKGEGFFFTIQQGTHNQSDGAAGRQAVGDEMRLHHET
jgi:hypothetical protein